MRMSTVEKLFVQIFERKNLIIQQVKRQTDLYNQNLAAKLLVDGITPPPWLWNPSQSSDVHKELNKEELISEILLPHSQTTFGFSSAHCSIYNEPAVAGDNGELLNAYTCNKDLDTRDEQAIEACCHDTHTGFTGSAPELDVNVSSPQDETEVRISSIYNAPDQSLARIHRSLSRQKALELRNSARGEAKSRLSEQIDPVVSSARNILSILDSKPVDQVNGELAETCVLSCESCGVRESNEGNDGKKEKGINFYTGKFTRSRSSGKQMCPVMDSPKVDYTSGVVQKSEFDPVQYKQEFPQCPDYGYRSVEVNNTSHVAADSCVLSEARAEDCWCDKEKGIDTCGGRISKSSSRQEIYCLGNAPEVGRSIGSILSQSSGKLEQQLNDANNSLELIKAPEGLGSERLTLQSTAHNEGIPMLCNTSRFSSTRSNSGALHESPVTASEVHKALDNTVGEMNLTCPDFPNSTNQQINFGTVNSNELMSHGLVKEQPVNSRSIVDGAGLECSVTRPSSSSFFFMEPKQLDFDDSYEHNLNKNFSPTLENGRLETSPEDIFGSSSDYQITPDKFNNVIFTKPSSVQPEFSTKKEEFCRGTWESSIEQHEDQKTTYGSSKNEHCILKTTPHSSEAVGNVPNSNFTCQADNEQSNAFGSPKAEKSISIYSKETSKALPELQSEEGKCRTEGKVKSTCDSHSSQSKQLWTPHLTSSVEKEIETSKDYLIEEGQALDPTCSVVDVNRQFSVQEKQCLLCLGSKLFCAHADNVSTSQKVFKRSYSLEENGLVTYGSVRSPLDSDKNLNLSRSRELQVAKKSRSIKGDSWPGSKRRKIEDKKTDSCSAPPSFRIPKLYCGQLVPTRKKLKQVGDAVEGVLGYASPGKKSSDPEIYQKMACQLTEVMKSSPQLHNLESELCSGEQNTQVETSSLSNVSKFIDQQDNLQFFHFENEEDLVNPEGLTCIKRTIREGKSYLGVDDRLPLCLDHSPSESGLELIGVDESMPVLEGFIIDSETVTEEVNIPGNQMNLNTLDLQRTYSRHASILEQICKSASTETPFPEFSSVKLHELQKLYQSVPTGLLEGTDLRRNSALNEDVDRQLRSSSLDYVIGSFQGMYSDCLPYSRAPFCWDSRKPYTSPVRKLWERMSINAGSSGKQLSSNPELTCFPIEEDPTISEDYENVGEVPGKTPEEIHPLFSTSAKREPLPDITGTCLNAPSSLPAAEKFVCKVSAHSVGDEIIFNETHDSVKMKAGNQRKQKSKVKENAALSMGATGKMSEVSLNNRFSKVNSSFKTNSRRERKELSEKVAKHNNIASNVTSFIPLVEQKQAAAVCTGKRDIRVKALEAAEAAKRIEEKKENERKMRKEALKLERARMEQENLRQMELNKKKNEEERKKKAADIVAKRRQRDEEEKKERERKRRRVEEARQQKREQGKSRFVKVEEKKQLSVLDERDNKEEASDRSEKSQDLGKEGSGNIILKKPETPRPNGSTRNLQQAAISLEGCGTSSYSFDQRKAFSALDSQIDDLLLQKTREKSYEISPYQCSDDEQEEEEDMPNRKFIPSWASKSCVALILPLQQGIEPDVIFPTESFCSTDEFLPRKPHKQLATGTE